MPLKPKVPCHHPGCAELVEFGSKYCEKHKPLHPEEVRSAGSRGYGRQWQKARQQFLAAHAFNQMVQDAVDHKIDLIYCKSVSRWARNAADALDMVKRLTGNHAHVIFEQEGIDTRNPGMLFQLSLAASIAQSESESISENLKWVYRHRAAHGIYKPHKPLHEKPPRRHHRQKHLGGGTEAF